MTDPSSFFNIHPGLGTKVNILRFSLKNYCTARVWPQPYTTLHQFFPKGPSAVTVTLHYLPHCAIKKKKTWTTVIFMGWGQ
jgi:hypothetical protein